MTAARRPAPAHAPTRATTRTFASPAAWRAWLADHHASSTGLWLRLFKKDTGRQGLSHASALDEALWLGLDRRPVEALRRHQLAAALLAATAAQQLVEAQS